MRALMQSWRRGPGVWYGRISAEAPGTQFLGACLVLVTGLSWTAGVQGQSLDCQSGWGAPCDPMPSGSSAMDASSWSGYGVPAQSGNMTGAGPGQLPMAPSGVPMRPGHYPDSRSGAPSANPPSWSGYGMPAQTGIMPGSGSGPLPMAPAGVPMMPGGYPDSRPGGASASPPSWPGTTGLPGSAPGSFGGNDPGYHFRPREAAPASSGDESPWVDYQGYRFRRDDQLEDGPQSWPRDGGDYQFRPQTPSVRSPAAAGAYPGTRQGGQPRGLFESMTPGGRVPASAEDPWRQGWMPGRQ